MKGDPEAMKKMEEAMKGYHDMYLPAPGRFFRSGKANQISRLVYPAFPAGYATLYAHPDSIARLFNKF